MDTVDRRNDMTIEADSYKIANEVPILRRREAIIEGSPAMADANAITEININASLDTKRATVGNLYKSLPDHSLSNSNCRGAEYISPWQDNFILSRFKRWLDEDYYIIAVTPTYKIITMLNVILIICVMILAYRMWSNDTHLEVVSNTGAEVSNGLKTFKVVVNDWLNPIIGAIVFCYSTWRVFKRTTGECKNQRNARLGRRNNVYRVNASG